MDTAPVQRALVGWRLVGVATTVLALGSGAHVLGGGAAPAPAVAALVGALVLLGAAALARRPLTVRVLLPAALLGQLGVHTALTWLGHGAGGPAGGEGGASGVATEAAAVLRHHGATGAVDAGGVQRAADVTGHGHALLGPMLAAHAVAMVATVLVLVATERGVLALAHRWAGLLPALLGVTASVVPGRPASTPGLAPVLRRSALHRDGAARRGPPPGQVLTATAA